ncbi:MAG: hypothetical protein WCA79_02140 [Anaerolineales bacterium]
MVGLGIAAFGIRMAFLSGTPLFGLFNRQIDPAFWSTGSSLESIRPFQQWIYGIWGAIIAGWGVFVTFIVHYPFRNKEKWAWNGLVLGLLVRFVLDTALSIFHKVYFNVAFNTALLILAGLPAVFTRKNLSEFPALPSRAIRFGRMK